jgi:hypothetical protein
MQRREVEEWRRGYACFPSYSLSLLARLCHSRRLLHRKAVGCGREGSTTVVRELDVQSVVTSTTTSPVLPADRHEN